MTRTEVKDAQGNVIGWNETTPATPEQVNLDALRVQALTAMAQNRAAIAAPAPTNAQVIQQVKNLSAQNNALIRLVLGLLDGTN